MGRKPEPEYIRELKGKKSKIAPEHQIKIPVIAGRDVSPPDYLDEFARVHWNRMVEILDGVKLFQSPTRNTLARYCQAVADYEAIQEERSKLGGKKHKVTVFNKEQLAYWARMLREYEKTMENFESEYGLTPASAARVRNPNANKKPGEQLAQFVDERPQLK